jgi:hypothetical protein
LLGPWDSYSQQDVQHAERYPHAAIASAECVLNLHQGILPRQRYSGRGSTGVTDLNPRYSPPRRSTLVQLVLLRAGFVRICLETRMALLTNSFLTWTVGIRLESSLHLQDSSDSVACH